jgi:DNA-binding XRE family transcriptional regulator
MPSTKSKSVKVISVSIKDMLHDGSKEFETLFKRRLKELDIARDIFKRRKALGLSQEKLAERAGVTQPLISKIESGDFKNFEVRTLIRIATALNARYDFKLIADQPTPKPARPVRQGDRPAARAAARG